MGKDKTRAAPVLKAEVFILYVADIHVSRKFYEDILGFKLRLDAGNYCELKLGGIGLGLMPKTALSHFLGQAGRRLWSDGAPRCEIYLLTEQPTAVVERLEKAGAKCLAPLAMRPWGDVAAYFEDPDGHILAIARRTDKFYEINYPSGGKMEPKPEIRADRISTFFEQDHRELDALLEGVPFGSPREALAKFKEFDRRLERHIHWEEGVLFPAVARKAPELEFGPIRVMKMEHQQIREDKAGALKALREGDGERARKCTEAMVGVLSDHNAKEERILYPACDSLLSEEDRQAVFEQIRTLAAPAAG